MFLSLVTVSKMPMNAAKAVFTDARLDNAKKLIQRLRKAHEIKEDKFLEDTFNQLAHLTRLRNDIAHYGAIHDSTNKFRVSDELWKLEKAKTYFVTKNDIEGAISDIAIIRQRLAVYMIVDWVEPDFSRDAPFPWRYKPFQPIRPASTNPPNNPQRRRRRRASET